MENKKVMRFGYEDTDSRIGVELYGLEFEINGIIEEKKIEELQNAKTENEIDKFIEELIGEGSIDKINEKRKKDGYKEMDMAVKIAVLGCITESYITGATEPIEKRFNNINNKYKQINNRNERRNYNKNYRSNRNYRRY